jgi:polyisoprenoid-binding protein YceI|tara:strand:+ start:108 stop:719 length:612 start_codon:yes stop_codon:yes gene_type:complete
MKKIFTLLMLTALASCNLNTSQSESSNDNSLQASDASYTINPDQSIIVWTGREVTTSKHFGNIYFASGQFEVKSGLISSGEFVVDMTTIDNQDLPEERRARLEAHLKSDDFFSVESHPTALLSILSSESLADGKWLVSGELTIKTFTHPVEFEMLNSNDGWKANLVFDRSKYEVKFRSGTFFENLGDKLIYDDIELAINLKTL